MIGIILASHGELANGVLNAGEMIFGKQEKVETVSLQPSEGPEDMKKKLQKAAKAVNCEEVLFLIDLWGGTPFNQVSGLLEGHDKKWVVVTGLNLPLLLETFGSRESMNTAAELALHVANAARDAIKIAPEGIEVKAAVKTKKGNAIPKGTVVGDGKIKYVLTRVDSRLLHGQVAMAWTKQVNPTRIIVVSDSVAKDDLRKSLIEQAAPPGVKANVIPVDKMIAIAKDPRFGNTKAMLLFENPEDLLRAINGGVDIKEVNIGSMAHTLGKAAVSKVLSLGKEDVKTFDELKAKGITFDVRKVPGDSKENMDDILDKAKKALADA